DPVSRALSDAPIGTSGIAQLIADRSNMSDVLRVKTVTFENQPFWAYNLEVSKDHTFFVGATRAWVHNGCPELTSAVREELAAAERNLVDPVNETGAVAATARGELTHSGPKNKAGFLPSEELAPRALELAKEMGIQMRERGNEDKLHGEKIPGLSSAAH